MDLSFQTLLYVVNTIGTLGVMSLMLWLFYRGDILPRRVYEELVQRLLDGVCERFKIVVDEIIEKTTIRDDKHEADLDRRDRARDDKHQADMDRRDQSHKTGG